MSFYPLIAAKKIGVSLRSISTRNSHLDLNEKGNNCRYSNRERNTTMQMPNILRSMEQLYERLSIIKYRSWQTFPSRLLRVLGIISLFCIPAKGTANGDRLCLKINLTAHISLTDEVHLKRLEWRFAHWHPMLANSTRIFSRC